MRELLRTRSVPVPAGDRPRRLRRTAALRSLVKETRFAPGQLVMPLFVISGRDRLEPIESLPGHARLSVDRAVAKARELARLGVGGVLLFGIPDRKDDEGTGAYDAAGPVPSALRALKEADLPLVLAADVCMCEYTSHGHCGIVAGGEADTRATLPAAGQTAGPPPFARHWTQPATPGPPSWRMRRRLPRPSTVRFEKPPARRPRSATGAATRWITPTPSKSSGRWSWMRGRAPTSSWSSPRSRRWTSWFGLASASTCPSPPTTSAARWRCWRPPPSVAGSTANPRGWRC